MAGAKSLLAGWITLYVACVVFNSFDTIYNNVQFENSELNESNSDYTNIGNLTLPPYLLNTPILHIYIFSCDEQLKK